MFKEAKPVVFAITFPFFISATPSVCSLRVLLDRIYRIYKIKIELEKIVGVGEWNRYNFLSRSPKNPVNPVNPV